VDDEAPIRNLLRRLLTRNGYDVDTVADARTARLELTSNTYDAVLCDVSLGGESGISLAKWIVAQFPDLPVLMVTGGNRHNARLLRDAGIDGLILKPFEPAEIAVNVERAIRRSARRRAEVSTLSEALSETTDLLDRTSIELVETQAELMRHEQVWEALVTSAGIGVIVVSTTGQLEFANPRARLVLGLDAVLAEQTDRGVDDTDAWLDVFHPADRAAMAELLTTSGPERSTAQVRTAGGDDTTRHLIVRAASIDVADGAGRRGVVLSIEEITELVATQDRLERRLTTDSTTGLPNRTSLAVHLGTALRATGGSVGSASAGGAVAVNVAAIREVASVDGELEFERIMASIAARLQHAVGPGEVLGRSGPSTFSIVVAGESRSQLLTSLPSRIMRALIDPLAVGDRRVELEPRIGVALAETGATAESILRDATLASEHADARGGVRVFNESLRAEAFTRLALEQALREAVSRRQLTLEYQPIVSTVERRLVGMEALSRWHHPGLGVMSPGVFVPIAEQLGLINELGNHVLGTAVAQIGAWNDEFGPGDFWVSCNVAPPQLDDSTFPDRVMRILDGAPVAAHRLCVEVTEDSMMSTDRSKETLDRLRRSGVRIALDDFGTGYSSLVHLIDVNFDILKLAGDLMPPHRGYGAATANGRQILGAVVNMAHSIGLDVVAEAVETEVQWDELASCGADLVQGWAFSKSRPPGDPFLDALVSGASARVGAVV